MFSLLGKASSHKDRLLYHQDVRNIEILIIAFGVSLIPATNSSKGSNHTTLKERNEVIARMIIHVVIFNRLTLVIREVINENVTVNCNIVYVHLGQFQFL